MELELRHLRYVLVLAEELNFTRAATRLGLAQSTLSAQVQRLERHLDVSLFERSPRAVVLTPAGEGLAARARALLAEASEMERDVRVLARQPRAPYTLRIVAETVHPELMVSLAERYPAMTVTLRHDAAEEGVAALASDDADLCHGWDLPSVPLRMRSGIAHATLVEEPMWAVVPAGHPLAGAPQISLAHLRTEAWVSASPGTRRARHLQAACQAAGFTPRIRYVADDQEMVRTLVGSGCCVDLAPPRHLPDGCRAVRLVEDVRTRLFFAWRTAAVPGWLAREVLETSRRAFLRGLARRGPEYARLVESDPARFPTLVDLDPTGWPTRRPPRDTAPVPLVSTA